MIYHFGPFALDSLARRLTRDGTNVTLSNRHVDVLLSLLARPGEVVAKETLVQAAWADVAVTDNSLEQAISMLRRALATGPPDRLRQGSGASAKASATAAGGHHEGAEGGHHEVAIETVPRRGYRLTGEVRREASKRSDAELDALLVPHRAWLEGRAALETLSVQNVAAAERAFRSVLDASPDHASAHVGLANALVFRFEATRIDDQPDIAALAAAMPHARDACRLEPTWAEAWATLAFVMHRAGQAEQGIAAVRRAVELEPDNWRHHLRLAFISWGEARLRAAQRTLQLMPGLALAHWLAASVHVARQAFDMADRELVAGASAQNQQVEGAKFGGVGLHWVSGLLRLHEGETTEAERHFERELACENSGHLYARECCSATWYARGAQAFHQGDHAAAAAAFAQVLQRVPHHPFALAANGSGASDEGLEHRLRNASERGAHVDVAVARTVRQIAGGTMPDAGLVFDALQQSPAGPSGWFLPVEPMLRPASDPARWVPTLALLRSRAS